MNYLVKILSNEDEEKIPKEDQRWHLLHHACGSSVAFCTGEVFGSGEGNATAEIKKVKRGGITCKSCIALIKEIKAVRL